MTICIIATVRRKAILYPAGTTPHFGGTAPLGHSLLILSLLLGLGVFSFAACFSIFHLLEQVKLKAARFACRPDFQESAHAIRKKPVNASKGQQNESHHKEKSAPCDKKV
jgi:hypothetical protein